MNSSILIALIPLFVGLITQATKFAIYSFRHGLNWSYILTHGHMPSTHSAFATSLLVSVADLEGIGSGVFAVSVALAIIILDDALRLRMYLGDQGRYLNMLVQSLNLDTKKYPRLKERVGHRTSEVIVGIFYGLAWSLLFVSIFDPEWISHLQKNLGM